MTECPPGTHSVFDFCPGDCTEPITAREILGGYGLPDGVIDEALMEHGHALANEIRDEAWPHERDERENQLIYKLADKIDPYEESK